MARVFKNDRGMIGDTIRVLWICQFTNTEIQKLIKPRKPVSEIAQWIPINLKAVEGDERFEVYVLSPHEYISNIKSCSIRGVHYIFYPLGIPIIGRHWPYFFRPDYWTNFSRSKRIVRKWVKKLTPDVIHLFGGENPVYSSTVLPLLKKVPMVLTIQGFISHTTEKKTKTLLQRIQIEQDVIKGIPVAFYRSKKLAEDLLKINPNIELIWSNFGSQRVVAPENRDGLIYDIVFWGRICKDKGADDLLQAVSILKEKIPNIKVCFIGHVQAYYIDYSKALGIEDNIYWAGFQETQEDVHKLAVKSKITVLPTYHDILPGTIVESMFLGIPVVSYDVDSNPEINEKEEVIKLVPKGDIAALVNAIYLLLKDNSIREILSSRGKRRATEMFDMSKEFISDRLWQGYTRAIELYNDSKV